MGILIFNNEVDGQVLVSNKLMFDRKQK